ncbi:MAG: nuclear transport factor 2 family protein [Proteobacteria bacterium]|nr:MAG: nuclear transport factor 2 family protein [Pseudomonadota bacterium]
MSRPVAEILRLENRLMQADLSGDVGTFRELIADGAMLATPFGRMIQKTDVLDSIFSTGEAIFSRYERSEMVLKEYASTIVVNCLIDLENSSFSGLFRFTRVWSQVADGWQVIAGHISLRHGT